MGAIAALASVAITPAVAEFRYTPPGGARPSFTVLQSGDEAALLEVVKHLLPAGLTPRYDRQVDTAKHIRHDYPDWRSLLFGEGLAFVRNGNELQIRPVGVASTDVELITARRSVAVEAWAVRSGDTLRAVLSRWGEVAGVEVIFVTDRRYRLEASRVFGGSFTDAVRALLLGLTHLPHPPAGELSADGGRLVVMHRSARSSGIGSGSLEGKDNQ